MLQVCEKIFVEKDQWQAHLKGGRHMRALKRLKRREAEKEKEQTQENELSTNS